MSMKDELLELKEKIDSDTKNEAEKKILKKLLLEKLSKKFNCNTLEEAIEFKNELEVSKQTLKDEIEAGISSLKKELDIE